METAPSRRGAAAPGAFTAFARFVLCGGGVGLASSFAVAALAAWIPWGVANALITAASTLLATELHARFTFGAGGRATWRQHVQSAGSAAATYAVTCAAMLVLHQLLAAPGAVLEQAVYLSASALAGVARFVALRLVVFARGHAQDAASAGCDLASGTASVHRDSASGTVSVRRDAAPDTASVHRALAPDAAAVHATRPVPAPAARVTAPAGQAALCRAA
ncbi:GtrA family protein [Streptomyces sp. NBC_00659]|uniref:GtrA family protein n=1 Tax=Streptomyces sp. NBC_00659 TaxID=2903669 RepID=UPI003FCEC0E1